MYKFVITLTALSFLAFAQPTDPRHKSCTTPTNTSTQAEQVQVQKCVKIKTDRPSDPRRRRSQGQTGRWW